MLLQVTSLVDSIWNTWLGLCYLFLLSKDCEKRLDQTNFDG
jgi:hypothetical protein